MALCLRAFLAEQKVPLHKLHSQRTSPAFLSLSFRFRLFFFFMEEYISSRAEKDRKAKAIAETLHKHLKLKRV